MTEPTTPAGIDAPGVTRWLSERVTLDGALHFSLISGGRSNLTFDVTDSGSGHWVLRRPPLGHVLATAHDMGREHRIIAALRDTDVPVPPTVGLCTDETVNGAPFFVMDHVEGLVLRDRRAAERLDPGARASAALNLIDVLAAIHAVDADVVGLGDLGRREQYVERQLKRWHAQWERSAYTHVTGIDTVHKRLSAAVPTQHESTIVHGDYRLDNCIVTPNGEIAAVLDWELCTLGDPLADVGLLLVYWSEATDGFSALPEAPTTAAGFPTRAQITERYATTSGRQVDDVDYFVALGYWKLACILAGVATRYAEGQMGDTDAAGLAELFGAQLGHLVAAAEDAAGTGGPMSDLYEFDADPGYVEPPLILGLDGWIDAGLGAANATATILAQHETSLVAAFDTDRLLDHRARRPTMVLEDGIVRELRWPRIELRAGVDAQGRGMLLLVGAEPDHFWHSFTEAVVDLALELDVQMVVGLGAYPAPVPHTRPVQLSCTASSEELAARIGFLRGSLEVPAGVQAAIEQHAQSVGIASVGAWAQVPHYTAAMPYPAASLALIEATGELTRRSLRTGELEAEASATTERIDELVRGNEEHAAMVHALEVQADATPSPADLPSGDELAAELERFLRDQPPGTTG